MLPAPLPIASATADVWAIADTVCVAISAAMEDDYDTALNMS